MIQGVIFDLGSTLMYLDKDGKEVDRDTNAALIRFLNENGVPTGENFLPLFRAAREDGWKIAEETNVEHTVEEALSSTLAQLGHPALDGLLPRAVERFFTQGEAHWKPYPGAIETLQALTESGLRVGLISNADDDGLVQRAVIRLGFAPYLHPVLSSAERKWRKPDPTIFRYVADLWHLPCDQIAMVGDAPKYDILGAHQAGMRGILIDRHEGHAWQQIPAEYANHPQIQPDATVETLLEIPSVIQKY